MAEMTQGLYSIINTGSNLAMDVVCGSDKSGANIQQWSYNGADAQLWSVVKKNNTWMIFCSLTDKAMAYKGEAATNTNVMQLTPNESSTKQYWDIVDSGSTYTYKSKTYTSYFIRPHGVDGQNVSIAYYSTSPGGNVAFSGAGNEFSKWIFVKHTALTDHGCYEIIPQWGENIRLGISGDSGSNGAKLILTNAADSNSQKFILETNNANEMTNYIIAANSQKPLDLEFMAPKDHAPLPPDITGYIQQWDKSQSAAQAWLFQQQGTVNWGGEILPVCEIKSQYYKDLVLDIEYPVVGHKVKVWPDNNGNGQRWVVRKTEQLVTSLTTPSLIQNRTQIFDGYSTVTYSNPTFVGKKGAAYQARYKMIGYNQSRTTTTPTNPMWMNVADDSTSRNGWGDAWTPTFINDSGSKTVTIPFSKQVTLNSSTPYVEIIFEVREFVSAYTFKTKDYRKVDYSYTSPAHGPVRSSTIHFTTTPKVTLRSMGLKLNDDWGAYIEARFNISTSATITRFRVRLLDAEGSPISSWGTNNDAYMNFGVGLFNGVQGSQLRRLPNDGESIIIEYALLNSDDLTVSGSIATTFHYASGSTTVHPTLVYLNDDTYCVTVSAPQQGGNRCYMEVPDVDGVRLAGQSVLNTSNNIVTWKCAPPLNRQVRILVINSTDPVSGGSANITGIGYVDVLIEAHTSVWNWSDNSFSEPYDMCAAIMVNAEKPPQQTRTYSPRITKYFLSGRQLPVAFAGNVVEHDLSITGIVLPENTHIYSQRQLNPYSEPQDISKLATLARKDIYPLYRSPYGDWSKVVIESVELKRDEILFFTVTVKQAAIGD